MLGFRNTYRPPEVGVRVEEVNVVIIGSTAFMNIPLYAGGGRATTTRFVLLDVFVKEIRLKLRSSWDNSSRSSEPLLINNILSLCVF